MKKCAKSPDRSCARIERKEAEPGDFRSLLRLGGARGSISGNEHHRTPVLRAPLGLLTLEPRAPELTMLHRYADTRRGIGDVVAGMARHEYDLELLR